MSNLDREYIAVSFREDGGEMMPLIRMSGTGGLKKVIRGVSGVPVIKVYHLDFSSRAAEQVCRIPWPDPALRADVILTYRPESESGTVQLGGEAAAVRNYVIIRAAQPLQTDPAPAVQPFAESRTPQAAQPVVDRDRVRELEAQKEQPKVLWPDELACELKKDIFGQDEAIRKISELISANYRRKTPEVEVIVLFGPTGVGKTEVGRALPAALERLTGRPYGFRQIALNEFIGEHSLNRFFGSPPSYIGYKDPTIFEPVRSNPYQVYLLDEIEKATERIWTGLMECFSSGVVRLADNSPDINLCHVIFIITSNIPVDMAAYQAASAFRRKELCRNTLAEACGHPEIAGKITNCLAFQPLPSEALTDIVSKFVIAELRDYGMELAHIDEQLMVQLKEQHSSYGARGVRDAVREALLAATVYDRDIGRFQGKKVELKGDIENILIDIVA